VNGESSDDEDIDLAALLNGSDLTPEARRLVYEAIVSGGIEGYVPRRESVLELIELAAGRITGDEYRRRVLAKLTHAPAKASPDRSGHKPAGASTQGASRWRRWNDIADVFNGPQDTNWETDRDLVAHEFKPAEKDAQAGSGPAADSGVP